MNVSYIHPGLAALIYTCIWSHSIHIPRPTLQAWRFYEYPPASATSILQNTSSGTASWADTINYGKISETRRGLLTGSRLFFSSDVFHSSIRPRDATVLSSPSHSYFSYWLIRSNQLQDRWRWRAAAPCCCV